MAELSVILQGLVENHSHEQAINELLSIKNIDNYLFSIAFVRKNGVDLIKDNMKTSPDKFKIFIGIRNEITSIQSIFSLLKIGIFPYVVDTASSKKIFHPKIYSAYNENSAYIILGSANLTLGGLRKNIEVSSLAKLDRGNESDENYLEKITETIFNLPVSYPYHVFQIRSSKQAVKLLHEGRLEDERLTRIPATNKIKDNTFRDDLKPMPTPELDGVRNNNVIKRRKIKTYNNKGVLVWESKPLTERSLNIPRGYNTNITGDTNLGRGLMEGIDFQTYFREVVFSGLNWETYQNSRSPHLERATMKAEIVIKNISYGIFDLEVTHDPRTDTRSYEQNNAMTKIKWGEARSLIAKRDLLERTLKIIAKSQEDFVISID